MKICRQWNLFLSIASLMAVPVFAAAAGRLPVTPMQTLGPFYPVEKPADRDADLTKVTGKQGKAQGKILYIAGRVLTADGKPVAGAQVEIWQANAHGRYGHPAEKNSAPLDPNFQGYGVTNTDGEGRYRFKTVKPGEYPAGDMVRTPHIHFQVTGKYERLVTQMYFPGEAQNEHDPILAEAAGSKALFARLLPPDAGMEPDALVAAWDIVLSKG